MRSYVALFTALLITAICGFAMLQIMHTAQPVRGGDLLAHAAAMLDSNAQPTLPPPESGAGAGASVRIPILVYHIVRPSYPSDNLAVRKLAVTPESFDAQLSYLEKAGYHVVGFKDLESYFASSTPLPPKPVILSFDDGWSNQYQYAFPVLQKHRDTAIFFIFTNAIGHRGFLTVDEIRTLVAAGMTIGDHSRSHPFLTKISDPAKLWDEINGSKKFLESEFGVPVTVFAYPFGQYNSGIIALLQKAGFVAARGDYWGGPMQYKDHIYELSAINVPTSLDKFKQILP